VTVRTQPAPAAVTGVTTPAGGDTPRTLTWNWNAPSNATAEEAGEGLVYDWVLSNGASGTTTATTISHSNLGAGNYSLTVTPRNSGGTGPAGSSGATTLTTPPPPPQIVLSAGADPGSASTGYHYHVQLLNFTSDVTLHCYDNGTLASLTNDYVKPPGWEGDLPCYSDGGGHYVIGNGVRSNTIGSW